MILDILSVVNQVIDIEIQQYAELQQLSGTHLVRCAIFCLRKKVIATAWKFRAGLLTCIAGNLQGYINERNNGSSELDANTGRFYATGSWLCWSGYHSEVVLTPVFPVKFGGSTYVRLRITVLRPQIGGGSDELAGGFDEMRNMLESVSQEHGRRLC